MTRNWFQEKGTVVSSEEQGSGTGADVDLPRLSGRIPEGSLYDPEVVLDRFLAWVEASGLTPYPAQEEALLELTTGNHVVLSTPTGSGKSLVALGLHFKAMCEQKRSFYTAPIKALVNQKFFELCDQFGAENVGMLTGDASINRNSPIICCTAEILANMALSEADTLEAPYVVMDEFHYFGDRDRGMAWQLPLLIFRNTQYLLMSATLGDTRPIDELIEARTGRGSARIHRLERPVPLDFNYRETPIHETIEKLLASGQAPVYIVHFTQREAAEQAQALTSTNFTSKQEKRQIADALIGFRFDTPYGKDIQRYLRHGIGIHHAGLLPKYRLLVERLAEAGLLRAVCGTDTLGVGVNIPIRTVLFTKLCKFDGEKVAITSVRDFLQIAGRAGRKGFDDQGSVVCQAPEHVIENKRINAKAAGAPAGRKKKIVKKKPPTKGYVAWDENTFDRLATSQPEPLAPRFEVTPGLLVSCLRSAETMPFPGSGYTRVRNLIALSLADDKQKRRLLRDAAKLIRSLRQAGIVELGPDPDRQGSVLRVNPDLQEDFSLHHTLSLYLVEAAESLDPDSPDMPLDLLSLVESILENPRALLIAQERRLKGELVAAMKADGVPYEERMEKLEDVSYPKPNAEFIYASFNHFAESHPWVQQENVRPKGIAREMYESYVGFQDYVGMNQMSRVEGILLRYLSQVHNTLVRTVPEIVKNESTHEMIAYLRTLLSRVDSSLLEEWEKLVNPEQAGASSQDAAQTPAPARLDPRAFRARIRSELHHLMRCLANRNYDEVLACIHEDRDDPWDVARLEAELAPFYDEYERILFDPPSRQAHLTLLEERDPKLWEARQVLCDDAGDNLWHIACEIRIDQLPLPDVPLLRLRRFGT